MLKLMQVNLAGPRDDASGRMARIAQYVRDEGVDIVVAQAGLDASGNDAPLQALIAALPTHGERALAEGMAILSRRPLGGVRTQVLGRLEDSGDPTARTLLIATVPDDDLTICAAYLSWVEAQAAASVVELLDTLGDSDALVIGDLNQLPGSAAIRALVQAGFSDTWARLRHGRPGYTFEVGSMTSRIDYVLERGARHRVTAIRTIEPDTRTPFSNHAALIAEIAA